MSNAGRLVLALIVILALGILVLPSTVSLFSGQHYWYDIDAAGNQIPCQKCHADIYEELNQSKYHVNQGTTGVADEQDCVFCHQANTSIAYANGTNSGASNSTLPWGAHAASTISCGYCHFDSSTGAPVAGGFGLSDLANDTGTYAAHLDFVTSAATSTLLEDSNEACIACHTHVAVKIRFEHYKAMEFNVTWNGSQYVTSGYKINTSTNVTNVIWGNSTGYGNTSYWSGWP